MKPEGRFSFFESAVKLSSYNLLKTYINRVPSNFFNNFIHTLSHCYAYTLKGSNFAQKYGFYLNNYTFT